MTLSGQIPLFGTQYVHLGRYSRAAGFVVCAMCGVSLAMSAVWSDCDCCRGFTEPVPPWAVLGGAESPAEHLPLVAAKEAA